MRPSQIATLFVRYRAKGDVEALAAVFDEIAPGLLQVARHLSARTCEPEDLVQATFVVAIERADTFEEGRPLVPWMMGILANQARLARRKRVPLFDERLYEVGVESNDDIDLNARELAAAVVAALSELPERYREVLIPHLSEGLKPHEIADRLGRPHGTVRAQLFRGLRIVRRMLPPSFAVGGAAVLAVRESLATTRVRVLEEAARAVARRIPAGAAPLAPLVPVSRTGGELVVRAVLGLCAALCLTAAWWLAAAPRGPLARGELSSGASREGDLELARPPSDSRDDARERRVARADVRAADERPAARQGAIEVRVVHARDRSPAAGIPLSAIAWGEEAWYEHEILARTDDEGRARFERLPAGRVGVHADRGEQHRVTLAPGAEESLEIVLPAGVDPNGIVLDRDGTPIADATVEVFADLAGREPRASVQSGRDGRFTLRGVDPAHFLRARHSRRAPGELVWLGGEGAACDRELALVLDEASAALAGSIVDRAGRPVAGAELRLSRPRERQPLRAEDGRVTIESAPVGTMSDGSGRFAFDEVPAGALLFEVAAPGFAPFVRQVRVGADDERVLAIVLGPGARIEGRATVAGGAPAAGALIRARAPGATQAIETRADAEGRYALRMVSPGTVELEAHDRGFGVAVQARIEVGEGELARWDPVTRPARTISGRTIGQDGRPTKTWLVRAEPAGARTFGALVAARVLPPGDAELAQDYTDDAGGFCVPCGKDGPHRLELRPRHRWRVPAVAVADDVEAGAQDVVLRVVEHASEAEGSLVDEHRRPLDGVRVFASAVGDPSALAASARTRAGRFTLSPLVAGAYVLHAELPGRGIERVGAFEIGYRSRHDLGETRLAPPGLLVVRCTGHAPIVAAALVDAQEQRFSLRPRGGSELVRGELSAGSYRLIVETTAGVVERQVEVGIGETVRVELAW